MEKRYVVAVWSDDTGEITHLVNFGEIWSLRSKRAAMLDIEAGIHEYFMDPSGAQVIVKMTPSGKRLVATESVDV